MPAPEAETAAYMRAGSQDARAQERWAHTTQRRYDRLEKLVNNDLDLANLVPTAHDRWNRELHELRRLMGVGHQPTIERTLRRLEHEMAATSSNVPAAADAIQQIRDEHKADHV